VPLDPALVNQLLQTPYITATPEIRQALFFFPGTSDPAVIAYDNANLADAMTRGFFLDAINVFTARHPEVGDPAQVKALTKVDQVNVPVLIQLGDQDVLFPVAFGGSEASYYSGSPSVTLEILSSIGHGFNVHTNHLAGWQQIDGWITNQIQ
jgi:pimeloyl-ACP methyl ester carboxylesterase